MALALFRQRAFAAGVFEPKAQLLHTDGHQGHYSRGVNA
jgi:hypothetical protein